MLQQVKQRSQYFIAIAIMFVAGLLFCLFMPKANGFVMLNPFHTKWLDAFFATFTHLGDGLLSVIAILLLFIFRKNKEALLLLLAFAVSGLLSAAFKNIFSMPRPKLFFELNGIAFNHFIEGVTGTGNSSFPSGHTTTAFAMATVFALLMKNKRNSIVLAFIAIMVGYSRIYLGQHFLQDVLAGSLLGTSCALLGYHLVYQQKIFKGWRWRSFTIHDETLPTWN